jgi:hypothetical protein
MKRSILVRFLLIFCLILSAFIFTQPATVQAYSMQQLGEVLDKMGPANPFAQYGITGQNIQTVGNLADCIDQGNDVVVCVNNAHNTPLGQYIDEKADIPSWFWDFVDLYVAFKKNDYWGIIYNLGQAAVCIVAQVLAEGIDVCGLVQDLINMAISVYNTAAQVIEWISDLGEAVWGVIEDAACDVLGWGCDDPPPPPPEESVIYGMFFAPLITSGEGLKRIESVHGNTSLDSLINTKVYSIINLKKFSNAGIYKAAGTFRNEVNKQWSGHVMDMTNGPLVKQKLDRSKYMGDTQILEQNAKIALDAYFKNGDIYLDNKIVTTCENHFRQTLQYEHLDRWIPSHKTSADQVKATKNKDWCKDEYLANNKYKLEKIFLQYAKGNCQQSGDMLFCSTAPSLLNCTDILKPMGLDSRCIATPALKHQAAKSIETEFLKKGSKLKYFIKEPQQLQFHKPAEYVCTRNIQYQYCDGFNSYLFGRLKDRIVKCTQVVDFEYLALTMKVKQVVDGVNKMYPANEPLLKIVDDPLFLRTYGAELTPQMYNYLHQSFGFGKPSTAPGFLFSNRTEKELPFDGLDTPEISTKPPPPKLPADKLKQSVDPVKNKIGNINPGNPNPVESQLGVNAVTGQTPQTGKGATAVQGLGAAKTGAVKGAAPSQKAPVKQGY